jgi:PKD repeat protein
MKKIFLLMLSLAFTLTACDYYYSPDSRFAVSDDVVVPYEEIHFYNYSVHASDFEWNFGDGTYSYAFEPTIYYTDPGVYEVRLAAFNGGEVSYSYKTITVLAPDLNIQVREYYNNYVVSNARVILYPTLTDWNNQTRAVAIGTTDRNGIVEFYNLPSGFYYMDISNSHHDNYKLAAEDVGYIKTPYIGGATTYITAYVDYYTTKSALENRSIGTTTTTQRPFDPKMSERPTEK